MKMFKMFEDSAPFLLGTGEDPALRTKKQRVRGKPLKSRRPYGRWNRIKVLWYRE